MKGLNKGIVAIIFILVIINIPKTALARAGGGSRRWFCMDSYKGKGKGLRYQWGNWRVNRRK